MENFEIYEIVHDTFYSGPKAAPLELYKSRKEVGYGLGNESEIKETILYCESESKYGIGSYFSLGLLDYDYDLGIKYLEKFSTHSPYSCYVYAVILQKKYSKNYIQVYKSAENMGSIPAKIKLLKHDKESFLFLKILFLKILAFYFLIKNGADERIKSII